MSCRCPSASAARLVAIATTVGAAISLCRPTHRCPGAFRAQSRCMPCPTSALVPSSDRTDQSHARRSARVDDSVRVGLHRSKVGQPRPVRSCADCAASGHAADVCGFADERMAACDHDGVPRTGRLAIALATSLVLAACSSDKPAAKPFALVDIENSNPAVVLVFGCPDYCPAKGFRMSGATRGANANANTSDILLFKVDKPGSLSYTVSIHGRRVSCQDPGPMPSRSPGHSGPFHLVYQVTRAGDCIVRSQSYERS